MRIVYFGAEVVAERCLEALLQAGHEVAGLVMTVPAREPTGWRRLWEHLFPRGLEGLARRHGIPVLQPESLRTEEFRAWLAERKPDLLAVSIYDRILPADVLGIAPLGGLNVHPSLLPRWRGPAPVARAILSGEAETGLTIHQMDAGVDTGPILIQRRIPIGPDDTLLTLFDRIAKVAPAAMLEAIEGLASGSLVPLAQQGPVTAAPRIVYAEGHLDWRASAERIRRAIRACHPLPGAFMRKGEVLTVVLEATPVAGKPGAEPGQVLAVSSKGVVVQAGDGALCCRGLRQGGVLIPPRQYARHFAVGEVLASGDWSEVPLTV